MNRPNAATDGNSEPDYRPGNGISIERASSRLNSGISTTMARLLLTPDPFTTTQLIITISAHGQATTVLEITGLTDAVVDASTSRLKRLLAVGLPWARTSTKPLPQEHRIHHDSAALVSPPVNAFRSWTTPPGFDPGEAWADLLASGGGGHLTITCSANELSITVRAVDGWTANCAAQLLTEWLSHSGYETDTGLEPGLLDPLFDQLRPRLTQASLKESTRPDSDDELSQLGAWAMNARMSGHRMIGQDDTGLTIRLLGENYGRTVHLSCHTDPNTTRWVVIRILVSPHFDQHWNLALLGDMLKVRYPVADVEHDTTAGADQLWARITVPIQCYQQFTELLQSLLDIHHEATEYLQLRVISRRA